MPGQKRKPTNPTFYDPAYSRTEFNTLKRFGDRDLYNEIELFRVLMDRSLATSRLAEAASARRQRHVALVNSRVMVTTQRRVMFTRHSRTYVYQQQAVAGG